MAKGFQPAFQPVQTPVQTATKAPRGAGKGIFDIRPSAGLASGLKRIGGRSGITRLGRSTPVGDRHGKIRISHRY
jgi:hypothetical protein